MESVDVWCSHGDASVSVGASLCALEGDLNG